MRLPILASLRTALVVSVVALLSSAVAPVAHAQDAAVSLAVVVDGDELTIGLTNITEPVGTLELEVFGLPPLDDECTLEEGIGVCNYTDDKLDFVALNPVGWTECGALVVVDLVTPVDEGAVTANLIRVTDVEGVELAGTVVSELDCASTGSDDSSSSLPAVAIAVAAIATLGVGFWAWRSRTVTAQAD